MGFEDALRFLKDGQAMAREDWRRARCVRLVSPKEPPALSYLEIEMSDGSRAPWTPTRCDLLETDWHRA
jgi:hypothetical protein